MSSCYEEIMLILSGLDNVSKIQLNRLFEIYGIDNVMEVMRKLNGVDDGIKLKTAFDYYSLEISRIEDMTADDKLILIRDIRGIIEELNDCFKEIGFNVEFSNSKGKKLWLCDKVMYCNLNYKNNILLERINHLYEGYIKKRNILVESCLKFVISVASEYYNQNIGLDFDELVQYGNIGLIRAVETYDSNLNANFLTYSRYWIKHCIILNSKKTMNPYKVPVYLYTLYNDMRNAIEELNYELGRGPSDIEVADFMGVTLDKFKLLKDTFLPVLSLDEPISTSIDGIEVTRIEYVIDENVDLEEDVIRDDIKSCLYDCMDLVLDDRERYILRNRYDIDDNLSVKDIAKIMGISSQRVYEISQRAMCKLVKVKKIRDLR